MENDPFNETFSSITQLNKEQEGLHKENTVEIRCCDYNADPVKITLDLQKSIKMQN